MRRFQYVTLLLLLVFLLSGCTGDGKTYGLKITIGVSESFTEDEIQGAIDAVQEKFKEFHDCTMREIIYNEKKSEKGREKFLNGKRALGRGLNQEDIIVLYTTFEVGSAGTNRQFKSETIYTNFSWTVIRDAETGIWSVEAWGY